MLTLCLAPPETQLQHPLIVQWPLQVRMYHPIEEAKQQLRFKRLPQVAHPSPTLTPLPPYRAWCPDDQFPRYQALTRLQVATRVVISTHVNRLSLTSYFPPEGRHYAKLIAHAVI